MVTKSLIFFTPSLKRIGLSAFIEQRTQLIPLGHVLSIADLLARKPVLFTDTLLKFSLILVSFFGLVLRLDSNPWRGLSMVRMSLARARCREFKKIQCCYCFNNTRIHFSTDLILTAGYFLDLLLPFLSLGRKFM